ncbi:MAG: hypothetical protein U0X20_00185 [Caldilineaceae bacterium]
MSVRKAGVVVSDGGDGGGGAQGGGERPERSNAARPGLPGCALAILSERGESAQSGQSWVAVAAILPGGRTRYGDPPPPRRQTGCPRSAAAFLFLFGTFSFFFPF